MYPAIRQANEKATPKSGLSHIVQLLGLSLE